MSRLFIGHREQAFISDIAKEFTKDVLGQYVLLFPVSAVHTMIDPTYDEAVVKVWENPLKLDAIVGQPEQTFTNSQFGIDRQMTLEVMLHPRDLLDKDVIVYAGDFLVYGNDTYEIDSVTESRNIFGQEDYQREIILKCHVARLGQMDVAVFHKLLNDSKYFKDRNQKVFVQQRGLAEVQTNPDDINSMEATGDVRHLRERLGHEMAPIALGTGPRVVKVETREDGKTLSNKFEHSDPTNGLYDED